jgi:hypothetical protein
MLAVLRIARLSVQPETKKEFDALLKMASA